MNHGVFPINWLAINLSFLTKSIFSQNQNHLPLIVAYRPQKKPINKQGIKVGTPNILSILLYFKNCDNKGAKNKTPKKIRPFETKNRKI